MFVNQVNIKDLFSTNPSLIGRRDQSDSAFDSSQSNSQFMFSQVDFTESQDFMSSGPSQTPAEAKISPGKKFYQRYMSKGLLLPKENQSLEIAKSKLSFKDQLAANKSAAKERDDREIISSIFSVIKESTYELKEAISMVQENVTAGNASKHQLKDHIAKVEENLSKHTVKFLDNLTTRDKMKDEIHELKEQLTQKETEVSKLKEQLKEAKSNQLKTLKDQLQKMHQEHKSWLSQHTEDITSQQKQLFEEASSKQQKFTEQQNKTIKKIETTLQKNVESNSKQKQKPDVHNNYQQWFNDLKESNEQQNTALQEQFTKSFEDMKRNHQTDMGTLIQQQSHLRTLYQQHRKDMEKYLQAQLQITKDGSAELKDLIDHICKETLPSVVDRQERQERQERQTRQEEHDFGHQSTHGGSNAKLPPSRPVYEPPVREYPKAQKVNIQFTERTAHPKDGFCSPLTPFVKTWNTKMLFSKRSTQQVDLTESNMARHDHSTAAKDARPQRTSAHPVSAGSIARGTKRAQDVMLDTSSSSADVNQPRTYRPSPMKRNQQKSIAQGPVKPPVAARNIKAEPRSPDARWVQALAVPANPSYQTRRLAPVNAVEVEDGASQFSSPSLSVSSFFFPTRQETVQSAPAKGSKKCKKRKKSNFAPKKRGKR